jgi:hypothetical protein
MKGPGFLGLSGEMSGADTAMNIKVSARKVASQFRPWEKKRRKKPII